jgi:aerobic-type carbon monoxide dehydrogenase small subunit (CoxS/CutS family)
MQPFLTCQIIHVRLKWRRVSIYEAALIEKGNGEMPKYKLRVNGSVRTVDSSDADKPLLYVLRGLGLTATKFGCGLGQCGACTVLADGTAVQSCQMTVANAQGKAITTLEGLGSASKPHPIQAAFIDGQVPQCGYCASGMIMSAAALLSKKRNPSEDDIRSALELNLCRCGSHARAIRAVMAASGQRG